MGTLQIEKFIDGKHETTFSIPTFLIRIVQTLLPQSAIIALEKRGINLQAIADAKKQGVSYSTTLNVREKGIDKKIVISLI